MPNIYEEALKVLGSGMLVVFGVMILLSFGIWLMGRVFVMSQKRASRELATPDPGGGDK